MLVSLEVAACNQFPRALGFGLKVAFPSTIRHLAGFPGGMGVHRSKAGLSVRLDWYRQMLVKHQRKMNRCTDHRRSGFSDALRPREILPYIKIPLVPDPHPLKIYAGIGPLCTFEGFSLVSSLSFPDNGLMLSRPAVSTRPGNGFNITANDFNHLPVGHWAFLFLQAYLFD